MDEGFIDFTCPQCGDAVSFPADRAGFVEACPMCSQALLVPAESGGRGGEIPIPFTSERLALRRLEPGDWKMLIELTSNEENLRFIDTVPMDEDAVLRWMDSERHVSLATPDQPFFLGIARKEQPDELIGYLRLHFIDATRRQAEFRLVMAPAFQRQGFGLEAAQALLRFCFEKIRLHRLITECDSRNAAALGLVERLGMRREGQFVQDRFSRGEWVNTVWHAMLQDEYCAARRTNPEQESV